MDQQEQRTPERKPDAQRKGGERRGPMGGNLLWYMVAVGVGMMLLTMWFNMEGGVELQYTELVKLLDKMADEKDPAKRAEVRIRVTQKSSAGDVDYYYWDPRDVVFDTEQISGQINS